MGNIHCALCGVVYPCHFTIQPCSIVNYYLVQDYSNFSRSCMIVGLLSHSRARGLSPLLLPPHNLPKSAALSSSALSRKVSRIQINAASRIHLDQLISSVICRELWSGLWNLCAQVMAPQPFTRAAKASLNHKRPTNARSMCASTRVAGTCMFRYSCRAPCWLSVELCSFSLIPVLLDRQNHPSLFLSPRRASNHFFTRTPTTF